MSKMTRYRNEPAEHALRYHFFEHVEGDLHEQRVITIGQTGDWLDPDTRHALMSEDLGNWRQQQVPLTPLVDDYQQVATTRAQYVARDSVLPTGTYRVKSIAHHFAYNGDLLPRPADHEAVLLHGGCCVATGGDPVAVVKFNPRLAEVADPYQRAILHDETSGQWLEPVDFSHQVRLKAYIDLLTDLVHSNGSL